MNVFNAISRLALRTITIGADPSVAQDPTVSAENSIAKDELGRAGWIAEAWGRRDALAPYLAAQRLAWWETARVLILESELRSDHAQHTQQAHEDTAVIRLPVVSDAATVVEFPDSWTADARRQWELHQEFATAGNRR